MHARSKKLLAAAGATLAVAAGAGGALAAGGKHARGPAGPPGPAAIASYLGLTAAQLRQQLAAGKTLAQIAVAQGKTVAGLEQAIYADLQAHLDRAVDNGRLTKAQEQTLLARLKSRLDDLLDHAFPKTPQARPGLRGPRLGAAVTAYLDITPEEYRDSDRAQVSLAKRNTRFGPYVKEFLHKDGQRERVMMSGARMKDADGRDVIWVIMQSLRAS